MSFELETATADASTLRRVAIDPVSRVEGHGKVTLLLDENDIVQQVRLHIVEFRGFEKFIRSDLAPFLTFQPLSCHCLNVTQRGSVKFLSILLACKTIEFTPPR